MRFASFLLPFFMANLLEPPGYALRVAQLESEGLTTSDAQGVADVEFRHSMADCPERNYCHACACRAKAQGFVGYYDTGDLHPQRGRCIGNYERRRDAEAASEENAAIVTPYLNGKHKSGWAVFTPFL